MSERIAHIVGNISSGGVASVVLNYYRNIDRSLFQFDFYSYGPSPFDEEIKSLGGRVFFIENFSKPFRATRILENLLKDRRYKIVHSHLNTLNYFTLKAAKKAGIDIRIAHNHSTSAPFEITTPIKTVLKSLVCKNATHLAACSRSSAKWIYKNRADDSVIFNNAIDLEKFRFNQLVRNQTRELLGFKDEFVLCHAGRFVYQKNHEFLLRAFEDISKSDENARLILLGSGKLEDKIRQLTLKLGLTERVSFLGERNDTHKILQASDVFLLPSHYEGLPVVAVESQASGLPIVMSDNVTSEIDIIDCKRLSLNESWTQSVLQYKNYARKDNFEVMKNAGFDIKTETKKLEKYYSELI